MTEKEKEERRENYSIWISEIQNRIVNWVLLLEKGDIYFPDDFSLNSLKTLEKIILEKYTIDSIKEKDNRIELDGIISYIGEALHKLLPNSKWEINLEDDLDVNYKLPCVHLKYVGGISPHILLRQILTQKRGTILEERVTKALNYEERMKKRFE